jgi:hypothetical protein
MGGHNIGKCSEGLFDFSSWTIGQVDEKNLLALMTDEPDTVGHVSANFLLPSSGKERSLSLRTTECQQILKPSGNGDPFGVFSGQTWFPAGVRFWNERTLVKAGYAVVQAETAKRVSVSLARRILILFSST